MAEWISWIMFGLQMLPFVWHALRPRDHEALTVKG